MAIPRKQVNFGMTDSGRREKFNTGAQRDTRSGKGRYDLISPIALRRLAIVLEKGAEKYCDRNWEKGMPVSRCLDSGIRHIYQYLEGRRDEDHLAHAMFNLMSVIHLEETMPELADTPDYTKGAKSDCATNGCGNKCDDVDNAERVANC